METTPPAGAASPVLTAVDNEQVVLAVLADRYGVDLDRARPGELRVVPLPDQTSTVRAFVYRDQVAAAASPDAMSLALQELTGDPSEVPARMARIAERTGGRGLAVVTRTGVAIPAPSVPVEVTDADDERLPEWVRGHFKGEAWVVTDPDGTVLSTAVLKRYDDRVREISVGTTEAARGRGLARAVVAAAARAVLAQGRAVVYNHEARNTASGRVAEAVGLHELGVLHAVVATDDEA